MEMQKTTGSSKAVEALFKAGAHFGYSKARRHPSVRPYIFGAKNKVEIFDLEKTVGLLDAAKAYVKQLGTEGKTLLFVGGKAEARDAIKAAAMSVDMPYVSGRWIGGTITNFAQVRSRVELMLSLLSQKEKGELAKYTKKERLLIDRKVSNLDFYFSGIVSMKEMPKALFVIDPKREHIAVTEAKKAGIPVIALAGSDCNLKDVDHAIVGNDGAVASIRHFATEIAMAYKEGRLSAPKKVDAPVSTLPTASAASASFGPKATFRK